MKTCTHPGWPVLLSESSNPSRKYKYTWEMVHNGSCWIGINTQLPNILVKEALEQNQLLEFQGYAALKTEVRYGTNSRIDLLLEYSHQLCYIEVKNVTLVENKFYLFPDAVTIRGQKHLDELINVIDEGHRAVMFYVIQRSDGHSFRPAAHIDPVYASKLKMAFDRGVEIFPYLAEVSPSEIKIQNRINFTLD